MLTNKNVDMLETMAQDFLQHRYKIFCTMGRRDADWAYYNGACEMIQAFGGEWRRNYRGDVNNEEQLNDPSYYSHVVIFPNKEKCERLNENAWKE